MGFLGLGRAVAGVDVGSAGIKVVRARPGPRPAVGSTVFAAVGPGVVADGVVADPEALGALLRRAVPRGPAVGAVGMQQAVVRMVRFPKMTERELDGALRWEAEKFIPWTGDTCLDRVPLATHGDEMEVLLVAVQRRAIDSLVAAFRGCRARLRAVDLEALAAQRALVALGLVADGEEGVYALVDLGEAATRVVVFSRGAPVVARALAPGGREFTRVIAAALGVDEAEAEAVKRRWGVTSDSPAYGSLRPVAERLAGEVWRSMEFFLLLNASVELERIFLIGGNALLPGMTDLLGGHATARLAERLGRAPREGMVQAVNPATLLGHGAHEAGERLDARFVTALGLALWRGG